jgi:hypothetical protein
MYASADLTDSIDTPTGGAQQFRFMAVETFRHCC